MYQLTRRGRSGDSPAKGTRNGQGRHAHWPHIRKNRRQALAVTRGGAVNLLERFRAANQDEGGGVLTLVLFAAQ